MQGLQVILWIRRLLLGDKKCSLDYVKKINGCKSSQESLSRGDVCFHDFLLSVLKAHVAISCPHPQRLGPAGLKSVLQPL